jgi:hypothetical protein
MPNGFHLRPPGNLARSRFPQVVPASSGRRNALRFQVALVGRNIERSPVFATLQYRSGVAITEMLDNGVFGDSDGVATVMTGLIRRVNYGLEGVGTRAQTLTLPLHRVVPHEANIFTGTLVHIPHDIGGGLLDSIRELGRLPDNGDYREMYSAVRASMRTTAQDLFLEVGNNTTTSSVNMLEAIISRTNRDPVMYLRDLMYIRNGGILAPGLPSPENIELATQIIRDEPSTHGRFFPTEE